MPTDAVLVLGWLLLAHLVADFVLQTRWMAEEKARAGGAQWRALLTHVTIVGVCTVPLGAVFGVPGLLYTLVAAASHGIIDRAKIVLSSRVTRTPPPAAGDGPSDAALGPSWCARPAALFLLDQLAHVVIVVVAWWLLLAGSVPLPGFVAAVDSVLGVTDRDAFHDVTVAVVVGASLLIVNVRAASLFVAILVRPWHPGPALDPRPTPSVHDPRAYTLRLGRFEGRLEPDAPTVTASPSPARVGEAIGILERLVILAFVLTGAAAAIGLVVAAKTLARFKQLDDREFAEYYLLGTLASVTVALVSGLGAAAVLGTL